MKPKYCYMCYRELPCGCGARYEDDANTEEQPCMKPPTPEQLEDELHSIFARLVDWGDAIEAIKNLIPTANTEEQPEDEPVDIGGNSFRNIHTMNFSEIYAYLSVNFGDDWGKAKTQIALRKTLEYLNEESLDVEPTFKRYVDWLQQEEE